MIQPASTAWSAPKVKHAFAIGIVLCSSPLLTIVFTAIPPVLSAIAQHFGGGQSGAFAAQLVMTLPTIGIILGGGPAGWLVERFGPRKVLLSAYAAFAICGIAPLYLDSLRLLLASRLLLGLIATCITTASIAIIGTLYSGEARARLLGYEGATGGAAGLISMLLAGVVGELGGWRAPFYLYLTPLFLLPIAYLSIPVLAAPLRDGAPHDHSWLRQLWPWYVLIVLVNVAVFMTNVQTSFLLTLDGHTRPSLQGAVIASSSLMGIIGSLAYGRLRARLGQHKVFLFALSQLACGILLLGLSQNLALTVLGCALNGLGGGLVFPHMFNSVLQRAPADARGRASGLTYSSMFAGDLLNPLIVAPLAIAFGLHGAFVCVGMIIVAGFIVAALNPWARRTAVVEDESGVA